LGELLGEIPSRGERREQSLLPDQDEQIETDLPY
jgi:hypothetical protein